MKRNWIWGGITSRLRTAWGDVMVEAAGIEPASASPLPLALHAYPNLWFNRTLPDGQGRRTAIPIRF